MAIGSATAWVTSTPAPDRTPTVKAYSMAGWFNARAISGSQYANAMEILTAEANGIGSMYIIWDHVGGFQGRAMFVSDQPSNPEYHTIDFAPPANTWVHLAAVFTGTQLLAYKNGSQVGSTTTVYLANTPSVLKSRLMRPGASGPSGYAADVGYWNAALTADEVLAMGGRQFSAASIRPTALWAYCPHVRDRLNWRNTYSGGAGLVDTTHPRIYAP